MKNVNFDRVHWFIGDDAENIVENVCQVTEEEVHEIFATVIGKERHDEEGVIEAKKRELESIKSYGTYEEDSSERQRQGHNHDVECSREG